MSETEGVDAPQTETPTPAPETEAIPRSEAQKAFAARDAAKAKARELESELKQLRSAAADAERMKAEADGDLQKQIELLQKQNDELVGERDAFGGQLTEIRSQRKRDETLRAVLASIPDDRNHGAAESIVFSAIGARLSDDSAGTEELAKSALEEIRSRAPHFLEAPQRVVRRGVVPSDNASPLSSPVDMRKRTEAEFAKQGRTIRKLF